MKKLKHSQVQTQTKKTFERSCISCHCKTQVENEVFQLEWRWIFQVLIWPSGSFTTYPLASNMMVLIGPTRTLWTLLTNSFVNKTIFTQGLICWVSFWDIFCYVNYTKKYKHHSKDIDGNGPVCLIMCSKWFCMEIKK